MPMGDELQWLLKEGGGGGGGGVLRTLSLKNRPTPFETRPTQVLKNPDIIDL